jgi:hypothetical protein
MDAIIFLLILMLIWREKLKQQNAHIQIDQTLDYDQYLYKLTLITGCSTIEVFKNIAAQEGIPLYFCERDFKAFLEKNIIPQYVTEFIDENIDFIHNAEVDPWTYLKKRY